MVVRRTGFKVANSAQSRNSGLLDKEYSRIHPNQTRIDGPPDPVRREDQRESAQRSLLTQSQRHTSGAIDGFGSDPHQSWMFGTHSA